MTQLINPDTSVTGRITYCLEYGQKVYHVPHKYDNAWDNWLHSIQHTDAVPGDVSVPLWFSYFDTFNGVYGNYGHVVVQVPGQGYYSSPWQQGTTHAVLSSIAEVQRIYHCKYVGWSEDIADVKVVTGDEEMKPTRDQIVEIISAIRGEQPSEDEIKQQLGQPNVFAVIHSLRDEAWKRNQNVKSKLSQVDELTKARDNFAQLAEARGKDIEKLKQSGGKIDKDSVLNYIKENTK